jgi:hypothetical protein
MATTPGTIEVDGNTFGGGDTGKVGSDNGGISPSTGQVGSDNGAISDGS